MKSLKLAESFLNNVRFWDFGKHADYNQISIAVKHDKVLFIQFKLVGKITNIFCTELTNQMLADRRE